MIIAENFLRTCLTQVTTGRGKFDSMALVLDQTRQAALMAGVQLMDNDRSQFEVILLETNGIEIDVQLRSGGSKGASGQY